MEDFVKILIVENEIEAQLIDSILTEREIPHFIRSYHDSAYDGIYQAMQGWGDLEAPVEYTDEINEVYQNLQTEGQQLIEDQEVPEAEELPEDQEDHEDQDEQPTDAVED